MSRWYERWDRVNSNHHAKQHRRVNKLVWAYMKDMEVSGLVPCRTTATKMAKLFLGPVSIILYLGYDPETTMRGLGPFPRHLWDHVQGWYDMQWDRIDANQKRLWQLGGTPFWYHNAPEDNCRSCVVHRIRVARWMAEDTA